MEEAVEVARREEDATEWCLGSPAKIGEEHYVARGERDV